jgi:putative nucleotidyltransferase with HDIG domain
MDDGEYQKIENIYQNYVDRFRVEGYFPPKQQIKHEHCLRVAVESYEIARDLQWTEQDAVTARTLGLLHDIGRFSQFSEFGTLIDHKSIDHAERGLQVLSEEGILAGVARDDRQLIEEGIRWHNKKIIPNNLPKDIERFVHLIRDADKLDGFVIIRKVFVEADTVCRDLLAGKDLHSRSNPRLVEQVKKGQMIAYADTRSVADYLLLQIGWIYDINYGVSMQRVRDREVLEFFPFYLSDDEGVREASAAAIPYRDKILAAAR